VCVHNIQCIHCNLLVLCTAVNQKSCIQNLNRTACVKSCSVVNNKSSSTVSLAKCDPVTSSVNPLSSEQGPLRPGWNPHAHIPFITPDKTTWLQDQSGAQPQTRSEWKEDEIRRAVIKWSSNVWLLCKKRLYCVQISFHPVYYLDDSHASKD
jgi:hypothetical protein